MPKIANGDPSPGSLGSSARNSGPIYSPRPPAPGNPVENAKQTAAWGV